MKIKYATLLVVLVSWTTIAYSTRLQNKHDAYLTGYVQSLFVNSYELPRDAIHVRDGTITIMQEKLGRYGATEIVEKITSATANVDGVIGVRLSHGNGSKVQAKPTESKDANIAMPNHSLFQPLIADPKWPRFTVAYQYHLQDGILKHVFAPNFGASFPVYRRESNDQQDSEWEFGIQAGLFGIMDIGKKQSALINADYFMAIPFTYRSCAWSGLVKFYHLSSHLGDEFMLTNKGKNTKRINLSYEGIDSLLSYNFDTVRLYGGGGYIVHKEPSYVKPLKFQIGAEYYASNTLINGMLRPVAGIDIKSEEQGRWYPGISCKVGVQMENSMLMSNKIQLMLEFYSGKSIHGQFYRNKVRYVGIGLQAFL